MKKLYEKSQLSFAIFWIVAYCVLMSVGDSVSASLGIEKAVSLPVALLLSGVLQACFRKEALHFSLQQYPMDIVAMTTSKYAAFEHKELVTVYR